MPITIQPEPANATQTYAHQCWQTNPAISPDYWHEAQGHTVSRIALNWQTEVTQPELLTQGVNLIVTTPDFWPATQAAIAASGYPAASFIVLCVVNPHTLSQFSPNLSPTILLPLLNLTQTDPQNNPKPPQNHLEISLTILENHVKSGHIQAYGVANLTPAIPLHIILQDAEIANKKVWGRAKRPALRWLAAPLSLLNLTLLTNQNTLYKQEVVTNLELAARLHLAVVGVPDVMPTEAPIPPAALAALAYFAESEQQLNTALGGWPTVNGQPLFSALAHLAQGQAPWPTPAHWQHWQVNIFPMLNNYLNTNHPTLATPYLHAAQALLPHGPALAQAAAQPLLNTALTQLSPNFPIVWQGQGAAIQAAMLLASLPAFTALALTPPLNINPLQILAKIPNPSFLLQTP